MKMIQEQAQKEKDERTLSESDTESPKGRRTRTKQESTDTFEKESPIEATYPKKRGRKPKGEVSANDQEAYVPEPIQNRAKSPVVQSFPAPDAPPSGKSVSVQENHAKPEEIEQKPIFSNFDGSQQVKPLEVVSTGSAQPSPDSLDDLDIWTNDLHERIERSKV